jgi:hypothetical protein
VEKLKSALSAFSGQPHQLLPLWKNGNPRFRPFRGSRINLCRCGKNEIGPFGNLGAAASTPAAAAKMKSPLSAI